MFAIYDGMERIIEVSDPLMYSRGNGVQCESIYEICDCVDLFLRVLKLIYADIVWWKILKQQFKKCNSFHILISNSYCKTSISIANTPVIQRPKSWIQPLKCKCSWCRDIVM